MRRLKLIGIGAGHPDHITLQAINALKEVDVVFVADKGQQTSDLRRARREVCERYMQAKPYRIIDIPDPARDRGAAAYQPAVAAWHAARATLYEQVFRDQLSENQCGAFLVWGDPSLYDSTLRVVAEVAARRTVHFEVEVIPGISSCQALAARHGISLNEIGGALQITTGRHLANEGLPQAANVVVMLDGQHAFNAITDPEVEVYWGAYLGMPDEILLSGKLSDLKEQIEAARAQARQRKGWIMDIYLLRKRPEPGAAD